ncbi:hypothetical protein BDV96DRAFT_648289 [Lophiotrema nucula]|uniref:BTB domain-containing protein n=1 Tax=Lophiotrema nucula TaxID=690887 RepID=A0A6A5Z2V0_9PLEO|nr:hypothetical protein BDV96DRAFT_648289 [Lophiotrema nucula]
MAYRDTPVPSIRSNSSSSETGLSSPTFRCHPALVQQGNGNPSSTSGTPQAQTVPPRKDDTITTMMGLEEGLKQMGIDVATSEGIQRLKLFVGQLDEEKHIDDLLDATLPGESSQKSVLAGAEDGEVEVEDDSPLFQGHPILMQAVTDLLEKADKYVEKAEAKSAAETPKYINAPYTMNPYVKSMGTIIFHSELDGTCFFVHKAHLLLHSPTFYSHTVFNNTSTSSSLARKVFDLETDSHILRIVVNWLHYQQLPDQGNLDSDMLVKLAVVANTIQIPALHNILADVLFYRHDAVQFKTKTLEYIQHSAHQDRIQISETTLGMVYRFGPQGEKLKKLVSELLARRNGMGKEVWERWKSEVVKYVEGGYERVSKGEGPGYELSLENFLMRV